MNRTHALGFFLPSPTTFALRIDSARRVQTLSHPPNLHLTYQLHTPPSQGTRKGQIREKTKGGLRREMRDASKTQARIGAGSWSRVSRTMTLMPEFKAVYVSERT